MFESILAKLAKSCLKGALKRPKHALIRCMLSSVNSCSNNSFEIKCEYLESILVRLVNLCLNSDFEIINEHLESMFV